MKPRHSVLALLLAGGACAGLSSAQQAQPREALRSQMRMSMPMRHPDVARIVGLTPAESSQLFEILADQALAAPDSGFLPTQDISQLGDNGRAILEQQRLRDADVAKLLGSRYEVWLRYRQSLQTRVHVEQLRRTLLATGQPIDHATTDSLVDALDVEMRFDRLKSAIALTDALAMKPPASGLTGAGEVASRTASRNRLLLDAAARWLTPGQLAEYSRQLDSQVALSASVGPLPAQVVPQPSSTPGVVRLAIMPTSGQRLNVDPRSMMPVRYPDVARVVGLTPAQTEKLFDLLVIHQAAGQFVFYGNPDPELMSPQALQMYERQLARDAAVKEMLGDRYSHWQPYQQTLSTRVGLQTLRSSLHSSGMPIDDATMDRLVDAIHVAMRPVPGEAVPASSGSLSAAEISRNAAERNARLLSAAKPLLDARQHAEYARILDSQAARLPPGVVGVPVPPQAP